VFSLSKVALNIIVLTCSFVQDTTQRIGTMHIDFTKAMFSDYVLRNGVRMAHCFTFAQIADMSTK
jgi:hypothetical protein